MIIRKYVGDTSSLMFLSDTKLLSNSGNDRMRSHKFSPVTFLFVVIVIASLSCIGNCVIQQRKPVETLPSSDFQIPTNFNGPSLQHRHFQENLSIGNTSAAGSVSVDRFSPHLQRRRLKRSNSSVRLKRSNGNVKAYNITGSPYLISEEIVVEKGETLVLEPGVTLRFKPEIGITVRGIMEARVSDTLSFA